VLRALLPRKVLAVPPATPPAPSNTNLPASASRSSWRMALPPCVRNLLLESGRIVNSSLFSDLLHEGGRSPPQLPVYVISWENSTVIANAPETLRSAGIAVAEMMVMRDERSCDAACRKVWASCLLHHERMYESYGTRTTLTHLAALARVVDRREPYALIVEDDAKLSHAGETLIDGDGAGGLPEVLALLASRIPELGVLQVGGCAGLHAKPSWQLVAELNGSALRAFRHPPEHGASPSGHRCSHAYIISQRAARAWLTQGRHFQEVMFDRNLASLFLGLHFNQDWLEPPLLCQTVAKWAKNERWIIC
jgi:hypothetical protein